MTTTFKPCDDVLKQLVTERRQEVVRLQKSQADHLQDLEARGQARVAALRKTLPKDIISVLDGQDETQDEAQAATKLHVDGIKAKLAASVCSPENETV